MNLQFGEKYEKLRAEVQAFCARSWPLTSAEARLDFGKQLGGNTAPLVFGVDAERGDPGKPLGRLRFGHHEADQAVHRWPDRLNLWAEWERLATNLADADREATAQAFYESHRGERWTRARRPTGPSAGRSWR